jgi:hypothetical protein
MAVLADPSPPGEQAVKATDATFERLVGADE